MDDIESPTLGISLSGILDFIETNGGKKAFSMLTTAQVCDIFIKPATFTKRESFCDMQHRAQPSRVNAANVFVSHAWGYQFLNVVDALENWVPPSAPALKREDYFFWFDIFSVKQHGTVDRGFEWWTTTFADVIKNIGRTLLVLEWEDPKPLSRVWCVWEIASTLRGLAAFDIIMGSAAEASFKEVCCTVVMWSSRKHALSMSQWPQRGRKQIEMVSLKQSPPRLVSVEQIV